ncbi:tRNA (5-methylaminomethyl-2-thiouridine)(34)-methyltransferase MnmD [Psychroflexus sp. ALD_RP9]|uniref:tRNA (5-methylaminomethyl-2-thiouridine)(34)-methyltransferase MnmD n=1 Tax=Psychroflexus sp. ALD_RP9 TaxID=2777186 RepID=UPI00293D4B41|nr:tRNA (5-methylaminomethyl-2-thiouridine)(34)-methyltransferase MnmD [Psychroflexus sp. ALD_RP9]
MLKRKIITTADGSTSLHIPEWNEHYHSKHGAIQEARHVFEQMGLNYYLNQGTFSQIKVLEAGFGTGLNALMTFNWAKLNTIKVHYKSLEAYPITEDEMEQLNFSSTFGDIEPEFKKLHQAEWDSPFEIHSLFTLEKMHQKFSELSESNWADIIFYDAFGPRVQPKLWEINILKKFYDALTTKGIFVTYCAKGQVRRNLEQLGFQVERLAGPPGKREMLRGIKS